MLRALNIAIDDELFELLIELAHADMRRPKDQAAVLLGDVLRKRGITVPPRCHEPAGLYVCDRAENHTGQHYGQLADGSSLTWLVP